MLKGASAHRNSLWCCLLLNLRKTTSAFSFTNLVDRCRYAQPTRVSGTDGEHGLAWLPTLFVFVVTLRRLLIQVGPVTNDEKQVTISLVLKNRGLVRAKTVRVY